MAIKAASIALLACLLAAGCGGGSDSAPASGASPCAASYSFTPVWSINGSLPLFQRLDARVGEPFAASVTLRDLAPPACAGLQSFSLGPGITLPQGLSLDTRTGSISGTPTEVREIAGVSIVNVNFPGFATGTTVLTTLAVAP